MVVYEIIGREKDIAITKNGEVIYTDGISNDDVKRLHPFSNNINTPYNNITYIYKENTRLVKNLHDFIDSYNDKSLKEWYYGRA